MSQNDTNVLKPSVDLGILIGLLLTDGSVRTNKKAHTWKINLSGKSDELHSIFKNKMKKIFGLIKCTEWTDKKGVNATEFNSKLAVQKLLKFSPTFRTKKFDDGTFPNAKIPEFFNDLSANNLARVFQIMFSADGCVSFGVFWDEKKRRWELKRRIQLSSRHPEIKQQIANLLRERFLINPRVEKRGLILDRKQDILKFAKEIRFVDGVKITRDSKNWCGFEKNQILDIVIRSMKLKKKDLQKFRTKEEIIHFLKTLVTVQAS